VNLSEPFIRRPVMTALLTLSAVLFGVLAYFNLPVNDLPAVDYPVISVQAGYPGASPQTVAANIATPLEKQFMQIPGLELITSKSTQGNCSLTLQFALSKSIDAAATDVQAAISRAAGSLPVDLPSPPTFTKTNPNDQPILYIALTSDSFTKGQLYDIASTQVQQRISILSGVSQVNVFGSKNAVRIEANPSQLAARGMSMNDLASAIQQGTTYQGAGQFDGPNRTFLLQPQGQIDSPEGYNNLIIGTKNGSPIYVKDVAHASEGLQDERVDMRFWIRGRHVPAATVIVAVYRQAGSNAVEVAQSVKELLPTVQRTLPGSITIIPVHDRSQTIVNSVRDVKETLVIAFILVVLVIFVFLGRARDTMIPIVAMPLSLLMTFIVMNVLGYSLDNLSLMALTLAIGFLVDDAIVFLENTVRRMEQGEHALEATLNGAREISFTILSMTVALAAVFIPLVFMSGLVGRIFREFAITIIVAIIASGVVSLTLTPLMCSRLLKDRGAGTRKTWLERVIGGVEHRVLGVYGRTLWFFLRHKWVSAVVWVLCVVGTFWFLYSLPKTFLPIGDSSFIWGFLVAQEGSSPQQMRQYQTEAEKVMHSNPDVEMTFTMTGNGQFLGSNQGLLLAFLDDPGKRPPLTMMTPAGPKKLKDPGIQQVAGALTGQTMMSVPGAMGIFTPQAVLQISTGAASRSAGQFQYALSGIDPQQVYSAADRLLKKLSEFDGFANPPQSDMFLHTPSLQINILRDRAAMYGVSAQRIESLLRNAYSQNYVYLIKKPEDQYQVILETRPEARANPQDLQLLYVRSDDGQNLIPLKAVATWEPVLGPQMVNHINQFTSVTISFNLKPGVPIGTATDFVEQSAREVVPTSIHGEFQGEALTFRQTLPSLYILLVLAVFVIYVILGILYESYVHPLTVLSTLPSAMVGGLATLWVFAWLGVPDIDLSLYAFVGLFMLMGIVKKNGIMIVDFAIQRVNQGQSAVDAIHNASMDRFRPIIMTTLAAVMGAVPIAAGWGSDGASRRPLGLVIVGGLIVSQFITLYVTPVIYLYLEIFQEKVLDRTSFFRSHRAHEEHMAEQLGRRQLVLATADQSNGNGDSH
jgi:HAE1 family hydrophobic/amphiphilic exporter-1